SVCDYLGQVHLVRGCLDAALATYQLALGRADGPGQLALPAAGIAYTGIAEVEYQRDELDAALRHVTEGIARLRPASHTAPMATGRAGLSQIGQATGDPAGALEAIGEAERVAPSPAVSGLVNPVPAQRARLMLAQGNIAAAGRWAQQHGLGPADEPGYPQEREYLVLARVLLAQDRPAEALALGGRLLARAVAQDRMGSVIEIQALRALALVADGDEPAAVRPLAEALTLASPQGHVRVFADEGPPMRALLGRIVAARRAGQPPGRGIPFRHLAQVMQAFDGKSAVPGSGPGTSAGVPGLADPLTSPEQQVLAMLAAGTPNRAIAEQLFVTVFTVKKHISHPGDLDAPEVMNPGPGRWRSLLGEVLFGLFVVAGWRVRVRRVDEGEHPGCEWLRRKQPQRLLGETVLVEPQPRACPHRVDGQVQLVEQAGGPKLPHRGGGPADGDLVDGRVGLERGCSVGEAARQLLGVAPGEFERPVRHHDLAQVAELCGELGVLVACGLPAGPGAGEAIVGDAAEKHHIGVVGAGDGSPQLVVEVGEVPVAGGWVHDAVKRHEHAGGDGCHPRSLSGPAVLNHQTTPVAGTHRLRPGGLARSPGRQHGMVLSVPGQLGAFPELSTVTASTQ